jgi:hypothetical protein
VTAVVVRPTAQSEHRSPRLYTLSFVPQLSPAQMRPAGIGPERLGADRIP